MCRATAHFPRTSWRSTALPRCFATGQGARHRSSAAFRTGGHVATDSHQAFSNPARPHTMSQCFSTWHGRCNVLLCHVARTIRSEEAFLESVGGPTSLSLSRSEREGSGHGNAPDAASCTRGTRRRVAVACSLEARGGGGSPVARVTRTASRVSPPAAASCSRARRAPRRSRPCRPRTQPRRTPRAPWSLACRGTWTLGSSPCRTPETRSGCRPLP